MTADSFSDLVLFAVCAWLAYDRLSGRTDQAGVGLACLLVGVAALLGVARFSSWEPVADSVLGAHRFASLVAAVAAFPILAFSIAFPASPIARHAVGAWWVAFSIGGLGVAISLLGFKAWAQAAPVLSAAFMLYVVLKDWRGRQRLLGVCGVLILFAGFAATLSGQASSALTGAPSPVQMLHYSLAAGLWLLASSRAPDRVVA